MTQLQLDRFIPRNIMQGDNGSDTFVTPIYISKKAKNGIYTMPKKASFEKWTDKGTTRRTSNVYREGYKLTFDKHYRYTGSDVISYHLSHPDFTYPIEIPTDTFQAIFNSSIIENSVIKTPLIYTTDGFCTEEMVKDKTEKYKLALEKKNDFKEKIKPLIIPPKDVKSGRVYNIYDKASNSLRKIFLISILRSGSEKLYLFQDVNHEYYLRFLLDNSWYRDYFTKGITSGGKYARRIDIKKSFRVYEIQETDPDYKALHNVDFMGALNKYQLQNLIEVIKRTTVNNHYTYDDLDSRFEKLCAVNNTI